jgi:hypothetical protein
VLRTFYGPVFHQRMFDNRQVFDFEGIRGRLLSSSYVPLDNGPMLDELQAIFGEHEVNGTVTFDYDTTLYYGQL